jgi:hypothetical protein
LTVKTVEDVFTFETVFNRVPEIWDFGERRSKAEDGDFPSRGIGIESFCDDELRTFLRLNIFYFKTPKPSP